MQKSIRMDIMLLWSCNCSINWIVSDTKMQEDDLIGERKRDYIVIRYMIEQLLLEDWEAASR